MMFKGDKNSHEFTKVVGGSVILLEPPFLESVEKLLSYKLMYHCDKFHWENQSFFLSIVFIVQTFDSVSLSLLVIRKKPFFHLMSLKELKVFALKVFTFPRIPR